MQGKLIRGADGKLHWSPPIRRRRYPARGTIVKVVVVLSIFWSVVIHWGLKWLGW